MIQFIMFYDLYLSIRNILFYRSLRGPKGLDTIHREVNPKNDLDSVKEVITETLLLQAGLTLYGRRIGRWVYLTAKQREIKDMVEQFNYTVTIGSPTNATPHRSSQRSEQG